MSFHFLSFLFYITSDYFVYNALAANAPWTELLDWLLRIAQSDVPSHRESAVEILGKLSIYLVDVIKNARIPSSPVAHFSSLVGRSVPSDP